MQVQGLKIKPCLLLLLLLPLKQSVECVESEVETCSLTAKASFSFSVYMCLDRDKVRRAGDTVGGDTRARGGEEENVNCKEGIG